MRRDFFRERLAGQRAASDDHDSAIGQRAHFFALHGNVRMRFNGPCNFG